MEKAKQTAFEARKLYKMGYITREEAKALTAEYAEIFNRKSRELARKYGQKPKLFSFAAFMR